MAKAPDWLANMLNSSPDLVEDSPQFRQKHQDMQKTNLVKAANSALDIVKDRTRQSELETVKAQMQMIQDMTPTPVPLSGPDDTFFDEAPAEMSTPLSPNIPGPNDFDVANPQPQAIPPPDPSMADTNTQPQMPQMDEVAEIQRIAQETGLTPQQVAAMTLLGKDIDRLEKEGAIGPPPQPPMPLEGPPMAPPAPMLGANGTQPSPAPMPTPMLG